MRYCEYCGTELTGDETVCPGCGTVLKKDGVEFAEYTIEDEEPEARGAQSSNEAAYVFEEEPQKKSEPPKEEPSYPKAWQQTAKESTSGWKAPRYEASAQSGPRAEKEPSPPEIVPKRRASALSIVSFVGSFLGWLAVPAVILAIVDLVKGDKKFKKHGLSVAALIIGSFMILAMIGYTFILKNNAQSGASGQQTAISSIKTPKATAKAGKSQGKASGSSKGKKNATDREKAALEDAKKLLESSGGCSYKEMIRLLKNVAFNGGKAYTDEEAAYAADNCGADWNEQAVKAAKYINAHFSDGPKVFALRMMDGFGFTQEEYTYALLHSGINWNDTALKRAQNLFDNPNTFTGFSREGMKRNLKDDGFTDEAVEYAAKRWKADYRQEAIETAKWLLSKGHAKTREEVITKLESDDFLFTHDDAVYAANTALGPQKSAIQFADDFMRGSINTPKKLREEMLAAGYTEEEADYAIRYGSTNWKQVAIELGNSVIEQSNGTGPGMLKETLKKFDFTQADVDYAARYWKADWKEQAYLKAKAMKANGQSKDVISMTLIMMGFGQEERNYAMKKIGY